MKRYKLNTQFNQNNGIYGLTFQVVADESSTGEWVKYEPWMEQAETQYKSPTVIPSPAEQKEPTICVKCEHHIQADEKTHFCMYRHLLRLDFVTGENYQFECKDKNHGNCGDFEAKE